MTTVHVAAPEQGAQVAPGSHKLVANAGQAETFGPCAFVVGEQVPERIRVTEHGDINVRITFWHSR